MSGVEPIEITMRESANDCELYFVDGQTSNPSTYGSCEIDTGRTVGWEMADSSQYTFNW